ncbi:MAG: hypothetical protein GY754_17320 [bacterium]|nr:hypothetical protein [bacterium]
MRSYYSDDDLYQYNFQHKTPETLRALLLTGEDIDKRLARGESPLAISVHKWKRVFKAYRYISTLYSPASFYRDILKGLGHKTCALCVDALNKYTEQCGSPRFQKDKCALCPLATKEICHDRTSTYSHIWSILDIARPLGSVAPLTPDEKVEHIKLGHLIERMQWMIFTLEKYRPLPGEGAYYTVSEVQMFANESPIA